MSQPRALSARETAIMLAALRALETNPDQNELLREFTPEGREAPDLGKDEIDALCQAVNFGEVGEVREPLGPDTIRDLVLAAERGVADMRDYIRDGYAAQDGVEAEYLRGADRAEAAMVAANGYLARIEREAGEDEEGPRP